MPDYKRNGTLVFDEIKLKADLEHLKAPGQVIG